MMASCRKEKNKRQPRLGKRIDSSGSIPRLSLWKRLLLAVVTVVLFFTLVEIVLAAFGVHPALYDKDPYVGFSSTIPLFVEQTGPNGKKLMATAQNKLGFFNPQQFPMAKSSGTCRIFCMGGSTTFGRPYDDTTSFCGWLRAMLPEADPTRSWEVVNAGGVSYASYRVAALMEELIDYKPDLFIIYSGHNEFLERRTYSRIIETPETVRGLGALASRTRLYAVIENAFNKLDKPSVEAGEQHALLAAEVNTILADSIGPENYYRDDEWHEHVLDHYRYNLMRCVDIARSVGANVILVTPGSNLRDCSPFKSEHRKGLSDTDLNSWYVLFNQAGKAFAANQWDRTLSMLDAALLMDDRYAQAHYLRGRTLWMLGRYAEAKTAFMRAIDEDICPLRATAAMLEIVKEVGRDRDVPVVDYVGLLNRLSKHETPGEELFLDHVHPTIEANRRLALLLLETMDKRGILRLSNGWNDARIQQITKKVEDHLDERAHAFALRNLARVFRWAGKFEEGYKLALRAAQRIPEDAEVHVLIGDCAIESGRADEAVDSFRQALQAAPDYVEARLHLADALAGRGQLDEAIEHYFGILRDNPDHAATYCNLGVAMSAKGNVDEAVAYLNRAIDIRTDFAEAHNSLGSALVAQGKPDEAVRHYERALQINSRYVDARYNLASVLRWQGRFDEAGSHFEQVLRIQPGYAEAHCGLGLTLFSQGKSDEANRSFHRALIIKPDCIAAHSSLGDILLEAGQLDEAIDHYRQALLADPQNAHVHCNLGVIKVRQGKYNEAVEHFRSAVQIQPDHVEAYNNLGSLLASTGQLNDAILCLRRALRTESGAAPEHRPGASSRLQTGLDKTINRYGQALRPKPDYAKVHYNLGCMLVTAGDPNGAIENFQEALRLKPNWPDPLNDAARILATHPDPESRDVGQATRLAERAVRLTGYQNVSVLETLAMCYAAAGRFDQASNTIESAIALASAQKDGDRVGTLREKLDLYNQGRP